jgi:hypothetical protein
MHVAHILRALVGIRDFAIPLCLSRTNYGAIARPYRPLLETPGCKCAKTILCRHLGSLNGDDGGWEMYRTSKVALSSYARTTQSELANFARCFPRLGKNRYGRQQRALERPNEFPRYG